jgi:hypothetical protein
MATDKAGTDVGIVTKLSPLPVAETVARLTGIIEAKNIRLFAVIDQRAEAQGSASTCGRPRWLSSAARWRARR